MHGYPYSARATEWFWGKKTNTKPNDNELIWLHAVWISIKTPQEQQYLLIVSPTLAVSEVGLYVKPSYCTNVSGDISKAVQLGKVLTTPTETV